MMDKLFGFSLFVLGGVFWIMGKEERKTRYKLNIYRILFLLLSWAMHGNYWNLNKPTTFILIIDENVAIMYKYTTLKNICSSFVQR